MNASAKGYSSDFALVAFTGFVFLLLNQVEGFINPYSVAGDVHTIDVVFAILALFFSSVSLTQTIIYPGEPRSRLTIYAVAMCFGVFFSIAFFQLYDGSIGHPDNTFSVISMCAFFKAMSTTCKYNYQITLNYQRQSCRGLSTLSITLDFIGCCFALAQIQLDSLIAGHLFIIYPGINVAKFLLSFISWCCDLTILL